MRQEESGKYSYPPLKKETELQKGRVSKESNTEFEEDRYKPGGLLTSEEALVGVKLG